jgi:hypothetical protein
VVVVEQVERAQADSIPVVSLALAPEPSIAAGRENQV